MKALRVSDGIVPVSDFKAQASEWLKRVGKSQQPLVITQHGKPAGVLLSPRMYDALTERARFVEAVHEGLSDSAAGRTTEHADVVAEVRKRRPPSRTA